MWTNNPKTNKKILLIAILIIAILFPIAGITINNYTTELLEDIDRKRAIQTKLRNKNKLLQNEVERLSGTNRLTKFASKKLGLQNPDPETLTVIIDTNYLK